MNFQPALLLGLPDEVALQCIARVPCSHHPTLSLVSKAWNSVVRSPLLFTIRSQLRCTEHFFYLNLQINSFSLWYHQSRGNRSALFLHPSIPSYYKPVGPAVAAIGSKIYVIGGSVNGIPSISMWVLDCRFNKWEAGPQLTVGRVFAVASVVHGKIYVMGGCVGDDWVEVFDPVTGVWTSLPSPIEVRDKWIYTSVVADDTVYVMVDGVGLVYNVVAAEWGILPKQLDSEWKGRAAGIGSVLCNANGLKIEGYDIEENAWKELKGVKEKLPKFSVGATMVNLCGRLCVVWRGQKIENEVEFMCAEIEVWKDGDGELCGSILWSGAILVVPTRASILHCVAVEL